MLEEGNLDGVCFSSHQSDSHFGRQGQLALKIRYPLSALATALAADHWPRRSSFATVRGSWADKYISSGQDSPIRFVMDEILETLFFSNAVSSAGRQG
jgi:hypothetical protein